MAVSSTAKLKTVSDKSIDNLLQELALQMGDLLRDDDVTAARLAKLKGISTDTARRFLKKKVAIGELVEIRAYSPSGLVFAYRRKT